MLAVLILVLSEPFQILAIKLVRIINNISYIASLTTARALFLSLFLASCVLE